AGPSGPRRPPAPTALRGPYHLPMDLGLAGARALVGGGSGGLGGAIGAALAAEGANVALVARPSDRLEAAVAAATGPGSTIAVPTDLATADGPAAAVAATVEALGGL